jgi:hypothetical protein
MTRVVSINVVNLRQGCPRRSQVSASELYRTQYSVQRVYETQVSVSDTTLEHRQPAKTGGTGFGNIKEGVQIVTRASGYSLFSERRKIDKLYTR